MSVFSIELQLVSNNLILLSLMGGIQLLTKVSVAKGSVAINYDESVLFLGSCFAENISKKLSERKFNVLTNPFGILYNPISIATNLQRISQNKPYKSSDLVFKNNKWLSFDHHSSFSNQNSEACLSNINKHIKIASESLKTSKTIFITLGSAWVYEYQDVGIVANCHKIPNNQFAKRLLSVKEILLAFDEIKKELFDFNVIFTVSPVRHVKDGLHENNLSKGTLHLAINNLVEQNANYSYFPAYELIVDELRDYRFYKDDLVHPTSLAVNYVWNKFKTTYCDVEAIQLISQIEKIKAAVNHKPFDFKSEAHQQFIKKQIELMDALSLENPFLNFEEDKKCITKRSEFYF